MKTKEEKKKVFFHKKKKKKRLCEWLIKWFSFLSVSDFKRSIIVVLKRVVKVKGPCLHDHASSSIFHLTFRHWRKSRKDGRRPAGIKRVQCKWSSLSPLLSHFSSSSLPFLANRFRLDFKLSSILIQIFSVQLHSLD